MLSLCDFNTFLIPHPVTLERAPVFTPVNTFPLSLMDIKTAVMQKVATCRFYPHPAAQMLMGEDTVEDGWGHRIGGPIF